MRPWFTFFRLPNLPTAPGDAIAGMAIALMAPNGTFSFATFFPCLMASLAALFMYMGGLADNDIVDSEQDRESNPSRPIPSGQISMDQARTARLICLLAPFPIGFFANLSLPWFITMACLLSVILLYNRTKDNTFWFSSIAMGMCRGLSLVAGALSATEATWDLAKVLLIPFFAWTAYVASLTILAYHESDAKAPVPKSCFLPLVFLLLPVLSCFAMDIHLDETKFLTILLGCSIAAYLWIWVVLPLRKEHSPSIRRKAIGQSIYALLYLQLGFVAASQNFNLWVLFSTCLIGRFLIRKCTPKILGS